MAAVSSGPAPSGSDITQGDRDDDGEGEGERGELHRGEQTGEEQLHRVPAG